MKKKHILIIVGMVLLVSILCCIGLVFFAISLPSTPIAPTYVAQPTYTPTVVPPTIAPTIVPTIAPTKVPTKVPTKIPTERPSFSSFSGYDTIPCSSVDVPSWATRVECYNINPIEGAFGILYYTGDRLSGIAASASLGGDGAGDAGYFEGVAAAWGNWNTDDFVEAMSWLSSSNGYDAGVPYTFGGINIMYSYDSTGLYVVMIYTPNGGG